jgi:hypothetical protein
MLDTPQQIRQEDEERDRAGDPEPGAGKHAALRSQDQAEDDAGSKDQHGILVFQAESREDAEPDPELLVAGFHNAYQQPGATHPEQRQRSRATAGRIARAGRVERLPRTRQPAGPQADLLVSRRPSDSRKDSLDWSVRWCHLIRTAVAPRARSAQAHSPSASACEPYREVIDLGLSRGRNAMAIWQELVDNHGYAGPK